jgi:hypothetical protein
MYTKTLESLRARFDTANKEEKVRLLQNGAVFAVLSIRTKTHIAERNYWTFIMSGRSLKDVKGILNSQRDTIEYILTLTYNDWYGILSSPYPELDFAIRVKGLGITKASFALACSGFGRLGCIDSRIQKQYSDILTPIIGKNGNRIQGKTVKAYNVYLEALEALYPGAKDKAKAQWEAWLEEFNASESFKTTHEILLSI